MEFVRKVYIVHYGDESSFVDGQYDPYKFKSKECETLKKAVAFAKKHCDFTGAAIIEETNIYKTPYGPEKEVVKKWECTQLEYYTV